MPSTSTARAEAETSPEVELIKEEPVDPLQMEMDEDEVEYDADKLNAEVGSSVCLVNNFLLISVTKDFSSRRHLRLTGRH